LREEGLCGDHRQQPGLYLDHLDFVLLWIAVTVQRQISTSQTNTSVFEPDSLLRSDSWDSTVIE
jgi:hypothetical protein